MAIIELDSTNLPDYVDPLYKAARPGDTIQWKTINGKFSIAIRDALEFFSEKTNPPLKNIEKFIIDSAGTDSSETYTIKTGLLTGTQKGYDVFCITNSEGPDAPPKIIITPTV